MAGFLDAAAEQVLGYSENMLLGAPAAGVCQPDITLTVVASW